MKEKELTYEELGPDSKVRALTELADLYIDIAYEELRSEIIQSILEAGERNNIELEEDAIEFDLDSRGSYIGVKTSQIGHKSLVPVSFKTRLIGVTRTEFPAEEIYSSEIEEIIEFGDETSSDRKKQIISDFENFIADIRDVYDEYTSPYYTSGDFEREFIEGIIREDNMTFSRDDGYMTEEEEKEEGERRRKAAEREEIARLERERSKTKEEKIREYIDRIVSVKAQPSIRKRLMEDIYNTLKPIVKWKKDVNGIDIPSLNEYDARLKIRDLIDNGDYYKYNISVSYDGNTIYSKRRIINEIGNIVKNGMRAMSEELYQFSHLNLGTPAHYNREGWIANYPTLSDYKRLIEAAEPPGWKSDVIEILNDAKVLLRRY